MRISKREIRESVRKRLFNQTNAGENVAVSRVVPHWVQNLPAINIFTESESVERFDESPKSYRRTMTLVIECVASGNNSGDLDGNLEEIADRVEDLVEVDETLGQCVNKTELLGVDYDYNEEGQNLTGSIILRYSVEYFTDALRPDMLSLDTLNEVRVGYKIGHHDEPADEVVEANDTIKFEGV